MSATSCEPKPPVRKELSWVALVMLCSQRTCRALGSGSTLCALGTLRTLRALSTLRALGTLRAACASHALEIGRAHV